MAADPRSVPERRRLNVVFPRLRIVVSPSAWAEEDKKLELDHGTRMKPKYANSLVLKSDFLKMAIPVPPDEAYEDYYTFRLGMALNKYDAVELALLLRDFVDCRIPHLTVPHIVLHIMNHPDAYTCLRVLMMHYSGADHINERVELKGGFNKWPEAIKYLVGWTDWHIKTGRPFRTDFDTYGLYPIHLAAFHGHQPACQLLHEKGADLSKVDNRGGTCLSMAAISGNLDAVQYFLSAGLHANHADLYGQTALHHAAFFGHVEVVKLLLEYGADPVAVDAWTRWPLGIAAEREKTDCVLAMLKYTSIETVNVFVQPFRRTALHYSAMNGDRVSVDAMLRYGHRADYPDFFGALPIHLTNDPEIRQMLEKRIRRQKPKPKK